MADQKPPTDWIALAIAAAFLLALGVAAAGESFGWWNLWREVPAEERHPGPHRPGGVW